MNRIILLCATALLALNSCDKKEEPIDTSKNAFLKSDTWQLKSQMYSADMSVPEPGYVDEYDLLSACKKDDYYLFKDNNQGIHDDYFLRCNTAEPQVSEFVYNVNAEDTYLQVYGNPDDIDGSMIFQGDMVTPNIDSFSLTYDRYDSITEKPTRRIYGFTRFKPTF